MTYQAPLGAVLLFDKTSAVIKYMGLRINYSPQHKGLYWGVPRAPRWKVICKKPSCIRFAGGINKYCSRCKYIQGLIIYEEKCTGKFTDEFVDDNMAIEDMFAKSDNKYNYQNGVGGILHPYSILSENTEELIQFENSVVINNQKHIIKQNKPHTHKFVGFLIDTAANPANNTQIKKLNYIITSDNGGFRCNYQITENNKQEINKEINKKETNNEYTNNEIIDKQSPIEGPVSYYAELSAVIDKITESPDSDILYNIDLNIKLS
jgi:hypothetical protein